MIIKGNSVGYPLPDPSNGLEMQGGINMNGKRLNGIAAPEADDDAANKNYVDDSVGDAVQEIKDTNYSTIKSESAATSELSADMLGNTILFAVSGTDYVFNISKAVSDTLPQGFEVAFLFWNANSCKVAFTGGLYAAIAGESMIQNAVLALPERYTMIAAKKITSVAWLVTGNVEVV